MARLQQPGHHDLRRPRDPPFHCQGTYLLVATGQGHRAYYGNNDEDDDDDDDDDEDEGNAGMLDCYVPDLLSRMLIEHNG